jgi:hypothetical protein
MFTNLICVLQPRALEDGDLDLAASKKEYLENKQRDFRKEFKNKKEAEWWSPKWFTQVGGNSNL